MVRGSSDAGLVRHHPRRCRARIWTARGVCPAMIVARTVDCTRTRDHPWWGARSIAPSHPAQDLVPSPRTPMALHGSSRLDPSPQTVSGPPLGGGRGVAMHRPPRTHLVLAVRERLQPACGSGAWSGDGPRSRAPPCAGQAGGCGRQSRAAGRGYRTAIAWATMRAHPTANTSFTLRGLTAACRAGGEGGRLAEARNRLRRPDGRLPAVRETTHVNCKTHALVKHQRGLVPSRVDVRTASACCR